MFNFHCSYSALLPGERHLVREVRARRAACRNHESDYFCPQGLIVSFCFLGFCLWFCFVFYFVNNHPFELGSLIPALLVGVSCSRCCSLTRVTTWVHPTTTGHPVGLLLWQGCLPPCQSATLPLCRRLRFSHHIHAALGDPRGTSGAAVAWVQS